MLYFCTIHCHAKHVTVFEIRIAELSTGRPTCSRSCVQRAVDPAEKVPADLGLAALFASVNQTGHFTFRAAQYVVNFSAEQLLFYSY